MIVDIVLSWKGPYPRFEMLKKECTDLYHHKHRPYNQCMLQTRDASCDDWEYGVGQTTMYEKFNPREINKLQPSLVGSEIEQFLAWLEVPVWRTRLMMVPPKTVYSLHIDGDFRLHLPIFTNPACYFMFPEKDNTAKLYHLPADGTVHWTNTRKMHTMMNCSLNEHRLHMVMCADILINT